MKNISNDEIDELEKAFINDNIIDFVKPKPNDKRKKFNIFDYTSELIIIILVILMFLMYLQSQTEINYCVNTLNDYIINASSCVVSGKPFNYSFY